MEDKNHLRGGLIKSHFSKIKNFLWSFIASIISTVALQLIIHPCLALMFDKEEYGELLFIVGVANVIMLTFGNSLGDIRLVMHNEYEDEKTGDFNVILVIVSLLSSLLIVGFVAIYGHVSLWNAILLAVFCFLGTGHAYLLGLLRTKLMFREGFISNVVLAISYVLGLLVVLLTKVWAFVFVVGYLLNNVYLVKKTGIHKHGFFLTKKKGRILSKYSQLSVSYALKSSLTYVDRFIIHPLLGPGMISVYTVSTVLGKCVSLAIQPTSNVLLGYYAQPGSKMTIKRFRITNLLTIAFGAVAFLCVWMFSSLFISLLYPEYVEAVKPYLIIGNLVTILGSLSSIVQPTLLKYAKMHWQITIQAIYGVLAVSMSIVLVPLFGLFGFCYAMLISNVVKMIIMVIVGEISIKKVVLNDGI